MKKGHSFSTYAKFSEKTNISYPLTVSAPPFCWGDNGQS